MRGIIKFAGIGALAYLGAIATASAVPAFDADGNCGDLALGTRTVDVSGADTDGLCYAQEGNLQNADFDDVFAGTEFEDDYQLIDKNAVSGVISYTDGTYSFDPDLWDEFSNLFLGFHFGNGQGDPDSFVVELLFGNSSGTFTFLGGADGRPNGLSNIYLFGSCPNGDCRPPLDVPEPGTLGLLGLGLAGLGFGFRRRRKI